MDESEKSRNVEKQKTFFRLCSIEILEIYINNQEFENIYNAQNFFRNAELGFYCAGLEDLYATCTFQVISDPSFKIVQVGNFFREPKKFFGRLFLRDLFL